MTMNRTTMQEKGVRAYVQWREASLRANVAYRAWASEAGSRDRAAFGLYLTALDAEEHAAEVYAELVRSADRLPRSEDPPLEPLRGPDRGLGWP
jgi:hypothetical protein